MDKSYNRETRKIIKTDVDVISLENACNKIDEWANNKETKYISITNTHDIVRSWLDFDYRKITQTSDMSIPDGFPVAWAMRLHGIKNQKRVAGPDLFENLIPRLARNNLRIFFYGSTSKVLNLIDERIKTNHPNLDVKFLSPPFRKLTLIEDLEIMKIINEFNPHVVFVGLGCPKQDQWIHQHKTKIETVFIGIGAAFDFFAKSKKRAPIFMQDNGMEWLFRLYKEPRRLFKRYCFTIILFFIGINIQIIKRYFKKIFEFYAR